MAGGVALNCVANGKLLKEEFLNKLYIQPASGWGGALMQYLKPTIYILIQNVLQIKTMIL